LLESVNICWSYANVQTTEGFTYVTPYWQRRYFVIDI